MLKREKVKVQSTKSSIIIIIIRMRWGSSSDEINPEMWFMFHLKIEAYVINVLLGKEDLIIISPHLIKIPLILKTKRWDVNIITNILPLFLIHLLGEFFSNKYLKRDRCRVWVEWRWCPSSSSFSEFLLFFSHDWVRGSTLFPLVFLNIQEERSGGWDVSKGLRGKKGGLRICRL